MITISDLINKIKWDHREDPDEYELTYIDRVSKKLIRIRYSDIKRIDEGFMVLMRGGEETSIPLHRIRYLLKKEEIIWRR